MHDFTIGKCELIDESIKYLEFYTKNISEANDFRKNKDSFGKLDATMMRLQVIGENIKKIIKVDPDFFSDHLQFDTNTIIRFRDFISHHYENDIPILKQKIQTFLSNNNEAV